MGGSPLGRRCTSMRHAAGDQVSERLYDALPVWFVHKNPLLFLSFGPTNPVTVGVFPLESLAASRTSRNETGVERQ